MKPTFPVMLGILAFALPSLADDKWIINKLDASKLPPPSANTPVTYEKDIKPIFQASCVRCHGEEQSKGGFRLDSLEAVMKGGKAGKMVVAGDSTKSLLVLAVSQQDANTAMPPKRRGPPRGAAPGSAPSGGPPDASSPPGGTGRAPGGPNGQGVPGGGEFGATPGPSRGGPPPKPLTQEQVALVRAWIDQGAK